MVGLTVSINNEDFKYEFKTFKEAKAFILGIQEFGSGGEDWVIHSPCKGACTMGSEGRCLGCNRTIKEIAEFGNS